jgi:hypothetical protein
MQDCTIKCIFALYLSSAENRRIVNKILQRNWIEVQLCIKIKIEQKQIASQIAIPGLFFFGIKIALNLGKSYIAV